jgi:ribonuclease HI
MRLVIHADGGCAPNPGQGRCGLVAYDERGALVSTLSKPLGYGTNNTAEWQALIEALKYTNGEPHCSHLTVRMDSRMVVEQANGRWKVKHPNLKPYAVEAAALRQGLLARGCSVVVEWVPRELNDQADALSR